MGKTALLIVDVQNDFCPGGSLPVPCGDAVMPVLNRAIAAAHQRGWPIIASRDWHPPTTKHFKTFGGQWPVHCVQGTAGAAFHPQLQFPPETVIISKGARPDEESYSAFEGTDSKGTKLAEHLHLLGIQELYIGGLATDYCVKCTALDALTHGFQVHLIADAVRGVDLTPGDAARALEALRAQGASIAPWRE